MTALHRDNVFETSETEGQIDFTLEGAVTGALTFDGAFGTGSKWVAYKIRNAVEDGTFEVGICQQDGTTLSRSTGHVIASSNAGALVDWGTGTKNVWCEIPGLLANRLAQIIPCGTTGGTSTAYTSAPTVPVVQLTDGDIHFAKFDKACGDNPTYNPSAVGAKKIYKNIAGSAVQLEAYDIPADHAGILRYDAALDAAAGGFWLLNLPSDGRAGDVRLFAMSAAPTGYLKCNGAAISRTTYAALFDAIGTTFGVGDGATTFNLPDLRGEFVRGWDDGRGIDSGRTFGSTQQDAFQNITGTLNSLWREATSGDLGAFSDAGAGGQSDRPATGGNGTRNINFNASNSPGARTASETRPRNVALLYCIKY